ncbi:hypothetical protein NPIL_573421 [Nephila pilipes]|uniref:Uncharacterized protein n=1 Tax=Nephila pilipes TaxID=299642 RepID=A0A8X6Q4Z0_NEPPI|nr:hypothetical protein NPIL_176641 [Nephila pilipes]GFU43811.1 hypothetical protein NPIL_568831 [Nephila pilipes]GFU48415.1 hypothetical protein NPIL_573421 [Nephila pilipes]
MSSKDAVGQEEARREDGQEEDEESSRHDAPPKTGFETAERAEEPLFGKLLRERERRCSKTGPKETIHRSRGTHEEIK